MKKIDWIDFIWENCLSFGAGVISVCLLGIVGDVINWKIPNIITLYCFLTGICLYLIIRQIFRYIQQEKEEKLKRYVNSLFPQSLQKLGLHELYDFIRIYSSIRNPCAISGRFSIRWFASYSYGNKMTIFLNSENDGYVVVDFKKFTFYPENSIKFLFEEVRWSDFFAKVDEDLLNFINLVNNEGIERREKENRRKVENAKKSLGL